MTPLKKKDTFQEYLGATEYISSSRAKNALDTGYKYKYQEKMETAAQKLGTAIHCAVLEPHKFTSSYTFFDREKMPYPHKDLKTKDNKDYKQDIEKEANENGQTLLEKWEYQMCEKINERTKEVHLAKEDDGTKISIYELMQAGEIETSFYAQDPETELYLKGRPDVTFIKNGIIADPKTTNKGGIKAFDHEVAKWDYPFQLAFHCKVVELATGIMPNTLLIIMIDKNSPYDIAARRLRPEDRDKAMDKVNAALRRIKEWEEQQYFPGYEMYSDDGDTSIIDIDLPLYYFND